MDPDLVKRATHGDERAFEALALATHPRLFKVAHGILRDPELAEDATQQALLESWQSLRRLRDRSQFEAWACHWLIAACRAVAVPTDADADADAGEGSESDQSSRGPFGSVVDQDELAHGFGQLSVDDRAVLVLRFLAGYEDEDAAMALDLSAGEVEARVESALDALEAVLDGPTQPDPGLVAQGEHA